MIKMISLIAVMIACGTVQAESDKAQSEVKAFLQKNFSSGVDFKGKGGQAIWMLNYQFEDGVLKIRGEVESDGEVGIIHDTREVAANGALIPQFTSGEVVHVNPNSYCKVMTADTLSCNMSFDSELQSYLSVAAETFEISSTVIKADSAYEVYRLHSKGKDLITKGKTRYELKAY